MILDGLTLTVVGMLVVFSFLTLIVFAMRVMSGAILRYFPEEEAPAPVRAGADDAEIAVAIAAAKARANS